MTKHEYISYERRNAASGEDQLIVFNHIMKCAGMSVLANLAGHFGDGHYAKKVDHFSDWTALAKGGFKDREDRVLSLGGHAAWGVETVFDRPRKVLYLTMLREPFALSKSLYRYSQMHFTKPRSFRSFVHEAYPANLMVKTLADGSLELAKQRLADFYFHFGLVERFDESLTMFRHDLGLPAVSCRSVNASSAKLVPVESDQALEQEFYVRNAMDLELYNFAEELFDKRSVSNGIRTDSMYQKVEKSSEIELAYSESKASPILELLRSGQIREALELMKALAADRIPYREIARHEMQLGNTDESISWIRKGMQEHPWMLLHEAELCEQAGKLECAETAAKKVLEATEPLLTKSPDDSHINRIAYDMLVTMARLRSLQGFPVEDFYAQAYELLPLRMAPRFAGTPLDNPVSVKETVKRKKRILVMRFGPLPVLSAFVSAMEESHAEVDILVQPTIAASLPEGVFANEHVLPNDRFVCSRDVDAVLSSLRKRRYEMIVVICNDQDLSTYDQVFQLCSCLDAEMVQVFPMLNQALDVETMVSFKVNDIVAQYRKRASDQRGAA